MSERELVEGIHLAMATTVQSVKKLENLLGEISKISTYVEGAADQVNGLAIKLTVSIAHREKLGLGLDAVAEESDAMEAYALKVLVEVSRQVELAGQRLMF